MAVTITVEDGSLIADANSYVSVADVRTYATQRGVTLPASDDEVAVMLINATDYLEAQALRYQGEKVDAATQALAWPRACVVLDGLDFATTAIPKQLVSAQCALVLVQSQGVVLQPVIQASDYVVEETVGPITTKYADPTKAGITPEFPAVDAILAPLFKPSQCGLTLRALRV
jgi:hypothetical protein